MPSSRASSTIMSLSPSASPPSANFLLPFPGRMSAGSSGILDASGMSSVDLFNSASTLGLAAGDDDPPLSMPSSPFWNSPSSMLAVFFSLMACLIRTCSCLSSSTRSWSFCMCSFLRWRVFLACMRLRSRLKTEVR